VPSSEAGGYNNRGTELYEAYQERLRTLNATDFGDLLLHCVVIFQKHPDVLAQYQRWFRYILVDEYQDTNVAQYLWLRLLAQEHKNICCVGDDDQSIYGWRGAEVDNILRFDKDFPGAKVIRLERNYRSTGHILAAASALITKNEGRLGKTLFTEGEAGNKITVANFWDDEAEARSIGDDIENLQRQKHPLNEVAILVRASSQMRVIEDRFITLGLPYRVIGGPRFYERQEIKDAIAYLEVVANPSNDLKFERIVNVPKRGLGDTTVKRVHELARARTIPMYHAAREICETDEIAAKARKSLSDLVRSFERWRGQLDTMRHTGLAELILDESGYTAMWQTDKSPQAQSRLENLKELVRFMHDFDTLAGFLEHVSLVMDADKGNDTDQVSLMTLHAAKGLEFGTVFLPGWEEGLFPHQRALDESGKAGLEEERRLAYVGITRAKRLGKISFAQNRRTHGLYQSAIPSRFVDELPEAHVEVIESQTPYGGTTQGFGYGNPFGSSRFDRAPAQDFKSDYQTPGWQRAQQTWSRSDEKKKKQMTRGPKTIEGELVASSAARAPEFKVGTRVTHEKFGEGTVTLVDGNKLTIQFDADPDGSTKRVVASFVERVPHA
jgi:DNA helicase-2/ATP-dependent DNA helicase PcrA